jgi:hypothetical protein
VRGWRQNGGVEEDAEAVAGEVRFWELAQPLLEQAGVTRSTMMEAALDAAVARLGRRPGSV